MSDTAKPIYGATLEAICLLAKVVCKYERPVTHSELRRHLADINGNAINGAVKWLIGRDLIRKQSEYAHTYWPTIAGWASAAMLEQTIPFATPERTEG